MTSIHIEQLERRLQFSGVIKYGMDASGDPALTGVLADTGPGLKDLGAQGVRLFTDVSFLASDFGVLPGGKIYVAKPDLVTSLSYARKYHDAGIAVTLCTQLSLDRSMVDGSLLIDKATGKTRRILPTELASPNAFGAWYDMLSKAQISQTDKTAVTTVLDFWEIGNEVNSPKGSYWPNDPTQPDRGVKDEMDSYVDHALIPAYNVLSKIHEPVIGAGMASGTLEQYNELNNEPGPRFHQYSNHVDYLNVHPYAVVHSPVPELTPQGKVLAFTTAMYGDGTVTKPFVITEYNIINNDHVSALDPDPNPRDAADQLAAARDLDLAHDALLKTPDVQKHCAWIYYYRLIATDKFTKEPYLPPTGDSLAYTVNPTWYDLFKRWTHGAGPKIAPETSAGVANLGNVPVTNAMVVQKDGKRLVLCDDGVRRYDAHGKLDPLYGKGGFTQLSFIGKDAALQSDGNLIVVGMQNDSDTGHTPYHLVATRLTTHGSLDKSFSSHGFFTQAVGTGTDGQRVVLRAGKIVIAGRTGYAVDGELVRLNLDGRVDKAFGVDGVALVKGRGPIHDIAVAKSGAITGILGLNRLTPQAYLVRFTSAGRLDKTFSDDGVTDAQALRSDGMFVDGDGAVLLVGHATGAERQVLVRYTSTGQIDKSFGAHGVQTLTGKKFIRGMPIELRDGSRYLYGSIAASLTSETKQIFVSKLSPHGQFDRSFGVGGAIILSSPNLQDLPLESAISGESALVIAAATFTQINQGRMSQELFSETKLI